MQSEYDENENLKKRKMGSARKIYHFKEYSFDSERLELSRAGRRTALKLQPARLLKILLESAPDTVTRKTLQDKIWDNGATVEFDAGLNACVNQLRTVLEDSAGDPKFIATAPKRGYRFIAPIRVERNAAKSRLWGAVAIVFALAVLVTITFLRANVNTPTQSPARIYVAPVQIKGDGLAEFEGVVQYALRIGAVDRLVANDLKVLQTINGVSLWDELAGSKRENAFDYSLFLTLAAHDEGYVIDAIVVGADAQNAFDRQEFRVETLDAGSLDLLAGKISIWASALFGSPAKDRIISPVAIQPAYYDAMVRARRAFRTADPASLEESLSWFRTALEIDPSSTGAKGGEALTLAVLAGSPGFPVKSTYDAALKRADEIRQTAGPTAQSELTRGFIYLYNDWDLERSRRAFDLAAELAPGDALVHAWRAAIFAAQGDVDAAASAADMAVALDPLSMAIAADRCWYLSAAGRFEEAVPACKWSLELAPAGNWSAIVLSTAFEKLGRRDEALEVLGPIVAAVRRGAKAEEAQGAREITDSPDDFRSAQCSIADSLAPRGDRGEFPLVALAAFNAQCGRPEVAADLLMRAKQGGESGILFYDVDPRFDEFRKLPAAQSIDMRVSPRS